MNNSRRCDEELPAWCDEELPQGVDMFVDKLCIIVSYA
jgi:hypothetical protein